MKVESVKKRRSSFLFSMDFEGNGSHI